MSVADDLGFSDEGLNVVTQSYKPGDKLELNADNCKRVTLQYGTERILVDGVRKVEDDLFSGSIKGFQDSHGVEYKELKLGQDITFRQCHITTCFK